MLPVAHGAACGDASPSAMSRAHPLRPPRLPLLGLAGSKPLVLRALKIGLPLAIANLVVAASLGVELLLVGQLVGPRAVGAVSLAANLTLVLILAFHAIEIAGQAIVARRFGERNFEAAGACLDNALLMAAGSGLVILGGLSLLGPGILGAHDPEVAALAYEYFRWRLPSIPFLIAILAIVGFYNGIGQPKVPMVIYAIVLLFHPLLLWLLAGKAGMGVRGAGLAASISTGTGLAVFLGHLATPALRARFGHFRFARNVEGAVLKVLAVLGAPILAQQILGNASAFLFQRINAELPDGGTALTAGAVGQVCAQLSNLPGFGMGIAAATLAGQYLGARKPQRAELAVRICLLLGAAYMVTMGILYLALGEAITRQFVLRTQTDMATEEVAAAVRLGGHVFIIIGLYQVFDAANTIFAKALQGVGLTKFVLFSNMASQWLVFVPLAWYLTLHTPLGGLGGWIAMGTYLAINAVVFYWKFRTGTWKSVRL